MKIYLYLLKSLNNGIFYVGISNDVYRRLNEHNQGKVNSTIKNLPFKVVYFKEHNNYEEARRHEKWLKKKKTDYKEKLSGEWARPA